MKKDILDSIKGIVDCSIETLHYLNIAEDDLKPENPLPVILAYCQRSGMSEDKERSMFDVNIVMLEKMPTRVFGSTDLAYEELLLTRQDEMAEVLETIIEILTGTEYSFPYELTSDAEYDYISNFTDYDYNAVKAVFTVSVNRALPKCCITFDKEKLAELNGE